MLRLYNKNEFGDGQAREQEVIPQLTGRNGCNDHAANALIQASEERPIDCIRRYICIQAAIVWGLKPSLDGV